MNNSPISFSIFFSCHFLILVSNVCESNANEKRKINTEERKNIKKMQNLNVHVLTEYDD